MTALLLRTARRPYAILGLLGLALAIAALAADMRSAVDWLLPGRFAWQVVTGLILALAMGYQWLLLVARLSGRAAMVQRRYRWHRWIGAAMTVLFVLHAVRFGYGWTSTLATVFLLTALTGLLNREVIPYRSRWHYMLWFGAHVALSAFLVPLTALHIWVALAFEGAG